MSLEITPETSRNTKKTTNGNKIKALLESLWYILTLWKNYVPSVAFAQNRT